MSGGRRWRRRGGGGRSRRPGAALRRGGSALKARSKAAFTRLLLRIHMRRLCSGWRGVAALASLVYVSVRVVASAACQAVSRSLSGDIDASAEVLVA